MGLDRRIGFLEGIKLGEKLMKRRNQEEGRKVSLRLEKWHEGLGD